MYPPLPGTHAAVSLEGQRWAEQLLSAAKTRRNLPALAGDPPQSGPRLPARPPACLPAVLQASLLPLGAQHLVLHTQCISNPTTPAPVACPATESHQLFMDDTSLENTFTCQPQQRNMHGRVFGGFLMRRAFELAHSTAYMFAGSRPRTSETFRMPTIE